MFYYIGYPKGKEEEDVAEGFIDLCGDMTADSESARGRGSRKWCPRAATAASCENQEEEVTHTFENVFYNFD
jgi:hypothetical protein